MNSPNKLIVSNMKIAPIGNKLWAIVYFDNGQFWIPALSEQGYIAYLVAECEKIKYPNLPWDAKDKPRNYLIECIKAKNNDEIIKITKNFDLEYHKTGETRESFMRILNIIKRNK